MNDKYEKVMGKIQIVWSMGEKLLQVDHILFAQTDKNTMRKYVTNGPLL